MKIRIIVCLFLASQIATGQESYRQDLISLAEVYHEYHASNPSDEVFIAFDAVTSDDLRVSKEFIKELIRPENEIATEKYLTKPDSITLRSLYVVRAVNYNMFEKFPKNNNLLVDSLLNETTNYHEQISCYYGMLFNAISNKNRPLKMSKYNFNLNGYELENDVEKAIFFLESMEVFGTLIWGYMNIPDPPNYAKALTIIRNYPKYNGKPYYEYLALDFDDFLLRIDKNRPIESFKNYYLNKYMSCVLSHSLCLIQSQKTRQEALDVLFKSILADKSFWEFSETPELYESIFNQIKG